MVSNVRNSSFELLRILSMLLVVLYHSRMELQGFWDFDGNSTLVKFVFRTLTSWGILGVNTFLIISIFYLKDREQINYSKLKQMFLQILVYLTIFLISYMVYNHGDYVVLNKFLCFHILDEPFFLDSYWFAFAYIALYLTVPILSKIEMKRQVLVFAIMILFLTSYYTPNFIVDYVSFVATFIIVKFCLVKYERFLDKWCVIGFVVLSMLLLILPHIAFSIDSELTCLDKLLSPIQRHCPFVVLDSLFLFLIFKRFNFHSVVINYIASLIFGVYLFHQCTFFNVCDMVGRAVKGTFPVLTSVFIVTLVCFIGGLVCEAIRKHIFYYLKNLL